MINLNNLLTEKRNPYTLNIDNVSTLEMCMLLNEEDKRVAIAIRNVLPQIAMAIDEITSHLKDGGRLFYIGAGTSGRLGILDAVECPPTYSTDPEMVQGIIAGGYNAIFKAQEGAEDSLTLAQEDLQAKNLSAKDCVVGIAASGRTPYVIGGLDFANSINALTIAISCTSNSEIIAFSSTSTDTCFPFSAAAARAAMIGEFPLTRYNVCLIASTSGSFAAWRTKFTTGSKLIYGWCKNTSPSRIT